MIAPARRAALATLLAVESRAVDLATALSQNRDRLGDERDRALATDIVTGTFRWRAALDYLIVEVAGRTTGNIDREVLAILRLSVYQLLHLTRVPASAVVDDAVNLTRQAGHTGATGFVNAVLRTLLRQRHRLPLPERPAADSPREAQLAWLSVTQSHPEWLVTRWLDRYGFEQTARWVEFNNTPPRPTLRVDRRRTTREALAVTLDDQDVITTPTRWAPDGLVVEEGRLPRAATHVPYSVQDEASQLVALMVGARPGERVLDLCASPGGKTTALATDMEDDGLLVACDVRPRRMRLLRETVAAGDTTCVRLVQVPRIGALPFQAVFDRVLVDAPCSGLGTLRRDPDIKWRREPADLTSLAGIQLDLLHRAAALVRPGGTLVYATCSSEPEENEDVVRAFIDSSPGFRLHPFGDDVPRSLTVLLDAQGALRTTPPEHELEAFFAAALVRVS